MSKLTNEYRRELAVRSTREPIVTYTGNDNLFGSIARNLVPVSTKMDFIPEDANGNIIDLTGNINVRADWLTLQSPTMQYWAYVYCSPLASVIDRVAEADTNGRIKLLDDDEIPIKKKSWMNSPQKRRLMKLLKKPNPLQTWEEFNSMQIVLCKIFGYCPVWAINPFKSEDRTETKYLFNLNPYFAKPIYRDEEFSVADPKSPIKYWTINLFGTYFGEIPVDEVLIVKDGFTDALNPGCLPLSKIGGLDYAISNIIAAMEADNVLLKKKGPLGVFSHDPRPDMAGWTPLNPDQKKELQVDLAKYGLSWNQLQYVISKQPLKWNAMSFNLRDLMTKETARQGIDMICDRFGYPAELMSGKNATYENRTSAEKFMYQNNIIPFSLRRMARYDDFFGLDDCILYMDYDHLPVLQEDIVHAGQAYKAMSEGLDVDWKAGKITWNEWRKMKNMDTVAGFDIYYPEWAKSNGIEINPPKQISNGTSSESSTVTK